VLLPRQRLKLARGAKDEEHAMSQNPSNAVAVIGIDIGKNSFHVVGLDARGAIVLRQKWWRGQVEVSLNLAAVNNSLTEHTQIVNQSESSSFRRNNVSSIVSQRHSLMFRPRSYMAFAITPQPPIMKWLSGFDASLERSESFFAGQHVALDLSAVNLSSAAISQLVTNLEERNIHILGIEGVDPAKWQVGLPPILRGGRVTGASGPIASTAAAPATASPAPPKQQPASLMIQDPVRSGQSVVFIEGDVTVLGSVASGAEIIAGGSLHVYGGLRGRARAGATGNARSRIFCHRVEAELLAIDSSYITADDIEDRLRCRPAQAWLEGGTLQISAMN
jgi:septum site-determining protein MinC